MALLFLPSQVRFPNGFAGDCLRPDRAQVGGFFFRVCLRRRALRLFGLALVAGLLSGCASNNLAAVAARHEGKTARQLGLPATLWCADFANLVRKEAGLKPINSRRAIDQIKNAREISAPVEGAIMITRRPGGHHIDFVKAVFADQVAVTGGNVAGRVTGRHVPLAAGRFYLPT